MRRMRAGAQHHQDGHAELPDSERYIQAASFSGLRQVSDEIGEDIAPLVAAVGLDIDMIESANGLIPFGAFCHLLERCANEWNVPDFGLRVAQRQSLHMMGPLALLTRGQATVGQALSVISDNLYLQSNAPIVVLDQSDDSDVAAILIDVIVGHYPTRQYVERAIGVARNILSHLSPEPVDLLTVQFRHAPVDDHSRAASFFGCPVEYRAAYNALYFDRALLERPIGRTDMAQRQILQGFLGRARTSANKSAKQAAALEIARQMETGQSTLESVADSLGVEPRTLQRRLKAEGTSFSELVEHWRRDRALVLVTQTSMPLADVADSLGYLEQSTFSTAFKRWFLDTPLRVRRNSQDTFG